MSIFQSVQSLSHVRLFVTLWTSARQASLSITNSQSLLKLMSIELVMPFNHLILCHPLLLPPSIFPSIRVFSDDSTFHIRWPKYWKVLKLDGHMSRFIFFNANLVKLWTMTITGWENQLSRVIIG